MVRLATNGFFRFCRKCFEINQVERRFHRCTNIKCPLCLSKMRTPFGPFWPLLIGCLVSADYWLADYPELRRTTQPSTIGGPLGEPGFCIFCSTDNLYHVWMAELQGTKGNWYALVGELQGTKGNWYHALMAELQGTKDNLYHVLMEELQGTKDNRYHALMAELQGTKGNWYHALVGELQGTKGNCYHALVGELQGTKGNLYHALVGELQGTKGILYHALVGELQGTKGNWYHCKSDSRTYRGSLLTNRLGQV